MGRGPTKAKAGGGASALAGPRPRQYRPGGVIQGTGLACLELEPAPDPAGAGPTKVPAEETPAPAHLQA